MAAIDIARVPASFRPFVRSLLGRPDAGQDLLRMLLTVGPQASRDDAAEMALLLRAALPESSFMRRVTDAFIRDRYRSWYIEGPNDAPRNRAFGAALAALMPPGGIAVEVGTGSGLFAMMAVRAGARHVYSFELKPRVAEIARENIARNGLSDRITVIEKRAEDAVFGEDIPEPGDLLIHEFTDPEFLFRDIDVFFPPMRRKLAKPDAPVLPQVFEARAVLCGDRRFTAPLRVPDRIEGFDVGAVNLLGHSAATLPRGGALERPLCDPVVLASYDVTSGGRVGDGIRELAVGITADGEATGIVRWIAHRFPDGTLYENAPGLPCYWSPMFWPLPAPRPVTAGETVRFAVQQVGHEVFVDLA